MVPQIRQWTQNLMVSWVMSKQRDGCGWKYVNKINKASHKYYRLGNLKISKQQSPLVMNHEISNKRHKSQFHKGMTLEQYFLAIDVNQETIPTADSAVCAHRDDEDSLYKTSHLFHKPAHHQNPASIREIQEQNFQDSLDQCRDCINIVSTNLKPLNKREVVDSVLADEPRKTYRIRNGKSMSPYNQHTIKQQNKKTISPYKTFMKKFYVAGQEYRHTEEGPLKDSNKTSMVRTLYGKQFELRRSNKNLKAEQMANSNHILSKREGELSEKQHKYQDHPKLSIKMDSEVQKLDLRVETLKDRLQMKRKNRNNK